MQMTLASTVFVTHMMSYNLLVYAFTVCCIHLLDMVLITRSLLYPLTFFPMQRVIPNIVETFKVARETIAKEAATIEQASSMCQ